MKVHELIAILQRCDPDAAVGSDMDEANIYPATSVWTADGGKVVTISTDFEADVLAPDDDSWKEA
jgi:hypothetical protein